MRMVLQSHRLALLAFCGNIGAALVGAVLITHEAKGIGGVVIGLALLLGIGELGWVSVAAMMLRDRRSVEAVGRATCITFGTWIAALMVLLLPLAVVGTAAGAGHPTRTGSGILGVVVAGGSAIAVIAGASLVTWAQSRAIGTEFGRSTEGRE
jgi:hypothetical protein